jgi:Trk K+ transport system NAD-binding subunit
VAGPVQLEQVTFIVLRHMRAPILMVIVVYAVSIGGMVLVPGPVIDGEPSHMGFFHAFYFLTYTATTTGFGEIPYQFSEAQRMWAVVSLYMSVIAWLYAIGSIFQLVRNPRFQHALSEWRFMRQVEAIREPFVIICGYGDTGSLLVRGLSDAGLTVVVLDRDEERIKDLAMRAYHRPMPGLAADARNPQHLIEAGLTRPLCQAVIALTEDERVNQKISVTTALLNPAVKAISLSTSQSYREVLSSLGENTHTIDPFQTYARFLGASLVEPQVHMLNSWMIGEPNAVLTPQFVPPSGTWVLCGFGRMGQRLNETLTGQGIQTVIIESDVADVDGALGNVVEGRANAATLTAAGIEEAAGLVVGTNNDHDNLSIILTARSLNPDIFIVVRQNKYENQPLFSAARADLIMQPSLTSARRILLQLTAPLLRGLFASLQEAGLSGDRDALDAVVAELRTRVGGTHPRLWTVEIGDRAASAVLRLRAQGLPVTLEDVLRDPRARDERIACVPLILCAGERNTVLPTPSRELEPGDEILFCGRPDAISLLEATLLNEDTLRYLVNGVEEPRGYVMRWFAGRRARAAVE